MMTRESDFETAILALTGALERGESVSPADVVRRVAEETGVEWEDLLRAVRRAAVKLAQDGRAIILRKGEPADPETFRGVYRIAKPDYEAQPAQPGPVFTSYAALAAPFAAAY